MLDIAWPELLVIGIVAVVAIGPKDLPKVMNQMGRMTGKARQMVQDVQRSFDQLNFEAEAAERVRKDPAAHTHATAANAAHGTHKHHAPTHDAEAAPDNKEPHDHLGTT